MFNKPKALIAMLCITVGCAITSDAVADEPCEPHWDNAIGQPGMNDRVSALAIYDDGQGGGPSLYAAGFFTTAGAITTNSVAKWDGENWSALGSGMNSHVTALTVFDDGSGSNPALYAGGFLTMAGGVNANRIAKWDGTSWFPLASGVENAPAVPRVLDLLGFDGVSSHGPALYVGGWFTTAGGVSANFIATW